MKANYSVVKDTFFGKVLGAALAQLVKARLAAGALDELDMNDLDVSMTLNGQDINLNQLFSSLEGVEGTSSGTRPDISELDNIADSIESIRSTLDGIQQSVSESCTDAINAASSSYYCGEYASDSANEAGCEYHPGEEFMYEPLSQLEDIVTSLRSIYEASLEEAA